MDPEILALEYLGVLAGEAPPRRKGPATGYVNILSQ
jgi:hypothetical protein